MYSYDDLLKKLGLDKSLENRKLIKPIINALIKNGEAEIIKQQINTDYVKVEQLYNILNELSEYFDYQYNTKIDLTKFLYYILNDKHINFDAIFCPGYTGDGYKDYIGKNNTLRMQILNSLSDKLSQMNIDSNFNIILANIFLENTDDSINPNWKEELAEHEKKFMKQATMYFADKQVKKLSDIYPENMYIVGFVNEKLCNGKTYDNFYKNNIKFYKKMNWDDVQIKYRNDRLFTIYNIISEYIKQQENGIYIPMETMYSRSKVISNNNVCAMYLIKK